MNTVEKIEKLLLEIETNYPELYQHFDEAPTRFSSEGTVSEKELEEYLDSIQQKLEHYREMHNSNI